MSAIILEEDVLLHIFGFLEHRVVLLRIGLVCRQWHRLSLAPELWQRLHMRGLTRHPQSLVFVFLQAYAPNLQTFSLQGVDGKQLSGPRTVQLLSSSSKLTTLDMTGYRKVTDHFLTDVFATKPLLQHVTLRGCYQMRSGGIVTMTGMCHELQHINLSHCRIKDPAVHMIGNAYRHQLKALYLRGCDLVTDVGMIALVGPDEGCPALPCLEKLDIAHCRLTDKGVLPLVGAAPRLEKLYLDDLVELTSATVHALCDSGPPMDLLGLHGCGNIDSNVVERVAFTFASTLRMMYLYDVPVDDEAIVALATSCPLLQYLDLTACALLTDRAMQSITEARLPHLGRVFIGRCPNITAASALDLLEVYPTLQLEVSIDGGISDGDVAMLKDARPGASILTQRPQKNDEK